MLDPRIYRTGLVVTALAVIVLAFSLVNQPSGMSSSLAPTAFSGQNVAATMHSIAARDPSRPPGSDGDDALASQMASTLRSPADGFSVSIDTFRAATSDGQRTLENAVATRPGTQSGSIVIVASRDAAGSPGLAGLSGTATLLELGRVLGGETLRRTVVLASISGSAGAAGARRLASTLPRPVDAVVVLGDLASPQPRQPVVIPWSNGQSVAPPALRNTVAGALTAQGSVRSAPGTALGGLAHLAFPLTISEQSPFGAAGIPAVEVSLSGERGPAPGAPISGPAQLNAAGGAILSTISALDSGPTVPAPSSYVLFDGKVVPGWAISLFVLGLIVPVALTTLDGVARARRRGHPVGRAVATVLLAAVPFALAALVVALGGLVGLVSAAPAGPVGPGAIPVGGGGIAVLAVAAIVTVAAGIGVRSGFVALGRSASRKTSRGARARAWDARARAVDRSGDGAAAAMLAVLCIVALLIWIANPFAALLLVPALHLWLWAIDSDLPLPVPARLAMIALGAVPTALLVIYYGDALGFGAAGAAWEAALLLAGHAVSLVAALEWSAVLGCLTTGVVVVVAAARRPVPAPAPLTVRGPITYAGPGSLGGTESALRR